MVEIIPPLVAASADDNEVQSLDAGSLHPAKTVPIATEPGVDVDTAGSQLSVHERGLNESYVAANWAVLVEDHLVGVMGMSNAQPVDLAVTGKISTEVREADVSLTTMEACALALMEYATGIDRLRMRSCFLALLMLILLFPFLFFFGFVLADWVAMLTFVDITYAVLLDYSWGTVASQTLFIACHPI